MNLELSRWLLADVPAGPIPPSLLENKPLLIGGGVVAGLFLVVVVVWLSGGKKKASSEGGLDERLGEYPPAPPAGGKRLSVQGHAGRLRLVVVAPVGKRPLEADEVQDLLDGLVRGLGEFVTQDRPRIRVWPPQLSQQGFAPTFGRHTHRPEPAGQPSSWALLAGPAKTKGQQILLGLAIQIDKPTKLDLIQPGPLQWGEVLKTNG